ncbi:MAG: response regulator [Bacteroidales bacterium]|nr:response regulator [Bacteroidales bacterium]
MNILEQKNNELLAYLEHLPMAFVSGKIIKLDEAGKIDIYVEDVNKGFAEIFGKPKMYFRGKQLLALAPEFESVLAGNYEPKIELKAGSKAYKVFISSVDAHYEVYFSKFKSSKASLVLKQIEQHKDSEIPIPNTQDVGIYKVLPDGKLLFANQYLIELLKHKDFDDIAKRSLLSDRFTLNYSKDQIIELLNTDGSVSNVESTWQTADGEVVFLREDIRYVFNSDGEVQYIESEVRDVSDQKISEYQLMHLNTIFHELEVHPERNIEIIVRKSAEVLQGDCSLFNRFEQESLKLINWARFNIDPQIKDDSAKGRICFESTIQDANGISAFEDLESTEFFKTDPVISKYGYKAYLGHSVKVDNEVVGSLCVLYLEKRKFTPLELRLIRTLANALSLEFKRLMLERSLNSAMEEVKVASDAKSQFLSNMSHEIRTPLNGIMGFSEILILGEEDVNKKKMLQMIEESGNQLLGIINDIFDYSTIDSGKLELNEREFNLSENFESAIAFFKHQAKTKGLKLTSDLKNVEVNVVFGDSSKFSQILVNLISNAIKFTNEGAVHLTAKSKFHKNKIAVEFVVSDTGVGIMKEDMEVIFSEFRQLEYYLTKRIKGTGIGLAITKKLVEFMGGTIEAESEPEKGSRFTVSLFMKNKSEVNSKTFMEDQEKNVENSSGNIRILLAEDNEANQFLIKAITKSEPWDITVVDDGEKAVQAYLENEYDLVLMDVQMPVMNGYEATRKIREIEAKRGSKTPIIALTAYAMKSDKDLCIEAGMDDYISKPFKRQEFLEAIANLLGQ